MKWKPVAVVVAGGVVGAVGIEGAGREAAVRGVIVVGGQAGLLEVVLAFHSVGGFAHLLHRGEQQPNEDADDGNDDEQFDEGETAALASAEPGHGAPFHLRNKTLRRSCCFLTAIPTCNRNRVKSARLLERIFEMNEAGLAAIDAPGLPASW